MSDGFFHCHVDNLSRQDKKHGLRFATATAAYIAGERLWSEVAERFVDFQNRADIFHSTIVAPENAPQWVNDRSTLWNAVDTQIKRKDARLAKTIEAALVRDIPQAQWPALLNDYIAPFIEMGCVADIAIHEDGTSHNPHVHIMLTTRHLMGDGFGKKIMALEQKSFLRNARKLWADLTNIYIEKAGSTLRVDHRSYKARGIEAEPTKHRRPNRAERRLKRERARRVREEHQMKHPTQFEKQHYPNLTKRDVWPPEPEASRDYTAQEIDEHRQYWDDQELKKLEEDYYMAGDIEPPYEPNVDYIEEKPWYKQALDNAREQGFAPKRDDEYAAELKIEHEARERAVAMENDVYQRALAIKRSAYEHRYLQAAENISPVARKVAEEEIILDRMAQIRRQDHEKRLTELSQMDRQALKNAKEQEQLEQKIEQGQTPVLSPDAQPISRLELDHAQDKLLEEHHRETPEMVRGPNGELMTREELDQAQERMLAEHLQREQQWDEEERER